MMMMMMMMNLLAITEELLPDDAVEESSGSTGLYCLVFADILCWSVSHLHLLLRTHSYCHSSPGKGDG